MDAFEGMSQMGHEQVVYCSNDKVGLKAIIAIHNTVLGPSLGGCRLYPYASEKEALLDVLRLSRGMTYKAAVAGLDLGGGKAVIIGDPSIKSEGLFRAFGRFVDSLGGRYITAEDMNTSVQDMNHVARETEWVTGVGAFAGGLGDPSPVTAWGVFQGIRASLENVFGSPSVSGKTVAIQGVGSVGLHLARYLRNEGANLVFSDISAANLKAAVAEVGGEVVDGDAFYEVDCDVLAPCAIGAVVNERTIPRLRAPIIAGAANNILEHEDADAARLADRNIIYVPDYVINGGGLIGVNAELRGWPKEKAMADASGIFESVKTILSSAVKANITTMEAANRLALSRLGTVSAVKDIYID